MKLTKFTGLLFVPFLLPSCNSNDLPLITKIDLTDSKLVLLGTPCAEGEKYDENSKPNDTSDSTLLYKVNNNNQIERVKISSKNSDDDLAFTSDCDFTLYDVDENYFRIFFSAKKNKSMYLVSKKTGECRSISSYDFSFSNLHYNKSSSYHRYVNVDGQGNYFGMGEVKIEQYSSNWITDQLIKTTVGENFELDTTRISKEEHPYSINKQFAVDKDGNAAYVATCYEKDHPACFHYITADGKDFAIDTNEKTVNYGWNSEDSWTYDSSTKGFWQGYDGEIYTNEEGYICKLVPKKDSNGEIVSVDQVRVSDKIDIPNNFFSYESKYVFFDDLQEIYLLDKGYLNIGMKTIDLQVYIVYMALILVKKFIQGLIML